MITSFENFNESDSHELAGIVLILDNQILLVNAKKYKNIPNKWSIPKGHIETDMTSLETAITELREEANIKLPAFKFKGAIKDEVSYFKNVKKNLTYYVLEIDRSDLDFKLYNDMILKYYLNKGEIDEAGFFSKEDAIDLIDNFQKPLLKYLQ